MIFRNWTIEDLIQYLQEMQHAPKDRLDSDCVPRCRGEIIIENGERRDEKEKEELAL